MGCEFHDFIIKLSFMYGTGPQVDLFDAMCL